MALFFELPWDSQPQEAVEQNRDTRSAFAWSGAQGQIDRNLASPAVSATATGTRQVTSAGQSFRGSSGKPIDWANGNYWITTHDGAGTGDFAVIVLANPASEAARRALFSQDNAGTNVGQMYLVANCTTGYSASAGLMMFGTATGAVSGDSNISASSQTDGQFHVWAGVRRGTSHELYRDGVLVASSTLTVRNILGTPASVGTTIGGLHGFTGYDSVHDTVGVMGVNYAPTAGQIRAWSDSLWSALFAPQQIWVPVSAGGGSTYTLTADGGSFALTGGAAALVAGRKIVAAGGSYTHTGGTTAFQFTRKLAADGGAFTHTGGDATLTYTPSGATYTLVASGGTFALTGGTAALQAARKLVVDGGAFALTGGDAGFTYPYAPASTTRRQAGGFRREQVRKGYIIKGKRYWLTEDELMALVAQELQEISRKDVKQITKTKPKVISKQVWDAIKPLERLEALTPIEQVQDDDEEDVLMMFV